MIVFINMESIYSYGQNGRKQLPKIWISLSLSIQSLSSPPSVLVLNSDFPFYNGSLDFEKCSEPWALPPPQLGTEKIGQQPARSQDTGGDGVRSTDGEFCFYKEGRMGIFLLDKLEERHQ